MAPVSTPETLQAARKLAHKLYGQCRASPSSYKLLAGSVKELRNVLEDVEDFLDDPSALNSDDTELPEQVSRSRALLRQLDTALQAYRNSSQDDVEGSVVADFKTNLDVTSIDLKSAYDALATGELPSKFDNRRFIGSRSPTDEYASTATSVIDSELGRRPSTQASSAWSNAGRESPNKAGKTDRSLKSPKGSLLQRSSQDKEVLDTNLTQLQQPESRQDVLTKTSSASWFAPYIDPMSISIEQASSMILSDLEPSPTSATRLRSTTESSHSTGIDGWPKPESTLPLSPAGLGISTALDGSNESVSDHQEPRTPPAHNRAHSASVPNSSKQHDLQPDEAILHIRPSTSISINTPNGHSVHSPMSMSAGTTTHLSPNTAMYGASRRARNRSDPSFMFTTRSAQSSGITTPEPSLVSPASLRKELDAILESSSAAGGAPRAIDERNGAGDEANLEPSTSRSIPSPPVRKAPLPPKPRAIPKIPKQRFTGRRITNLSPNDELYSSDEDLYSSSKPTSPMLPKPSTMPDFIEYQNDNVNSSNTPTITLVEERPSLSMKTPTTPLIVTTAEDRSFETVKTPRSPKRSPPVPPKMSKAAPAENVESLLERPSPPLKRHSTSAASNRDSSVTGVTKQLNSIASLERAATARQHTRSLSSNEIGKARIVEVRKPGATPNENKPASLAIETAFDAPPLSQTERKVLQSSGVGERGIVTEKEMTTEDGLEVKDLDIRDAALVASPVKEKIALPVSTTQRNVSVLSTASKRAPEPAILSHPPEMRPASGIELQHSEWYAPGTNDEAEEELDLKYERISRIIYFWNSSSWDSAAAFLRGFLESLIEDNDLARARRVRHLLGVCASFKGQWLTAIPYFLSVLRSPIKDESEIDDGDCAAAYWLGDIYSMLNQRTEALLAYCLAERSSLFQDADLHRLGDCIAAEQEAIQLGDSKTDMIAKWAKERREGKYNDSESILSPKYISQSVARALLQYEPRRSRRPAFMYPGQEWFRLDQNKARTSSLTTLSSSDGSARVATRFYRMKLTPTHFKPDTAWPMMYDPLFAMANVQKGRLLAYECDLISVFNSNAEAKIPKSSLTLGRMDCFTSTDLTWLIQTIRDCLHTLEMDWSEVANVEGTWFVVRYSFMSAKIATTYYFSIALFRTAFRSGYGVDICPDGICSARIIRPDWEHSKGVHHEETKKVRKLIKEFLEEAGRRQPKGKRKNSLSGQRPVLNEPVPPLPPRPVLPNNSM